jgi:hypothetical protein
VPRRPAPVVVLLAALAVGPGPERAAAQDTEEAAPVALAVAPGTGDLEVRLGDLLADGSLRRAIHQGLPLRIGLRAELWQDRFFDSQRGEAEWRASIVYDPVGRGYQVGVQGGPPATLASLDEAARFLQEEFRLPIRPRRSGRFYYVVVVEMETLSLSDLEELQRWLRGELAPAVAGEEDVEGAVGRGMRRLFVRALGLPTRRLRLRTATFGVEIG